MVIKKPSFIHLLGILVLLVMGQKSAHAQVPLKVPTIENCRDKITTTGNRIIMCRIEAFQNDQLYFSLPPGSPYTITYLPKDSIQSVETTTTAAAKALKNTPIAKVWKNTNTSLVIIGPDSAKSIYYFVQALYGHSVWTPYRNQDKYVDELVGNASKNYQQEYRLSITSKYGFGGFAWFDNRSSSATLSYNQMHLTTSLRSGGVGVVKYLSLAKKKGYFQTMLGVGASTITLFVKKDNEDPILDVTASGAVVYLSVSGGYKIIGPLSLGVNIGLVMGSATYTYKTIYDNENMTHVNGSAVLSLRL